MASGELVVEVLRPMFPLTGSVAEFNIRQGGSTPAEAFPVWGFDDTTAEFMQFLCRLSENYSGGGLTFTIPWSASSAASGGIRWQIAIRRLLDDTEDVDDSHGYSYNGQNDTTASASGELSYPTISFTDGADMDSWAAGELAVVTVLRNISNLADDMVGDAELWHLIGRET